MNTAAKEVKDLSYFQQQVAEKYGMKDWDDLIGQFFESYQEYSNEAAEYYAQYLYRQGYRQGKQEGEEDRDKQLLVISDLVAQHSSMYDSGWNEALHWAAEETQIDFVVGNDLKKSILNGLKQEEE